MDFAARQALWGEKGSRRLCIMVRHNVKRRWEKPGGWNPDWGFPGRNVQPNDCVYNWEWWAQRQTNDGSGLGVPDARRLVTRAFRLRQNVRRGDTVLMPPKSQLGPDTTISEAETSIISRPWFIFQIELAEEESRYQRLSASEQLRYKHLCQKHVIEWWKECGDWSDKFNRSNWFSSWKWRHESPSPEPEDLTPVNKMKDSPLDTTDMEFTPSEIGDFEIAELPSSEQPKKFGMSGVEDIGPFFPGQFEDPVKRTEEARRRVAYIFRPKEERCSKFDRLFAETEPGNPEEGSIGEHEAEPQRLHENASEAQQDTARSSLQKPQDQRQPRENIEGVEYREQTPPPRRSARVVGMKCAVEPLPLQKAPKEIPRGRKATIPAALTQEAPRTKTKPRLAQPSRTRAIENQPKRRQRREDMRGTRSAVVRRLQRRSTSKIHRYGT